MPTRDERSSTTRKNPALGIVIPQNDSQPPPLSPTSTSSPVTPYIPSLAALVAHNVTGESFCNENLIAIIIKAQPHHSRRSLLHLTRPQLIDHVNALITWWKNANPRRASLITQEIPQRPASIRSGSLASERERDDCCCVIT